MKAINIVLSKPHHERIKHSRVCKYQNLKNTSMDTIKWLEKRSHLLKNIDSRCIPTEALLVTKKVTLDTVTSTLVYENPKTKETFKVYYNSFKSSNSGSKTEGSKTFAEEYKEIEFVQEALAQITWYHNITLIEKVKDKDKRIWYVNKTMENGWSRNALVHQIESNLFERQNNEIKTTNFMEKLEAPNNKLAVDSLKDPYIFDFITMTEEMNERDIKTGKFKPEYAGKLNFYLSAVDDILRTEVDNPSIDVILCK